MVYGQLWAVKSLHRTPPLATTTLILGVSMMREPQDDASMAENESGTQKQGIFCSVSSDSSKQHDTIIAAKAAFAKPFFMEVFVLVVWCIWKQKE